MNLANIALVFWLTATTLLLAGCIWLLIKEGKGE